MNSSTRPTPGALTAACPWLREPTAAAVREARALANLTRAQAAAWLDVTPVHLARVERGAAPARAAHVRLLLLVAGFIVAPGWSAWRFHDGELYGPCEPRRGFSPGHLHAARWAFAQVQHQRALARHQNSQPATSTPSQYTHGSSR